MINIIVNGITDLKQIKQLDGLDVEFAALEFRPGKTNSGTLPAEEVKASDFDVKKIGVFADASLDDIIEIVEDYDLDVVQLAGDESPELCEQLSETLEVIKSFTIDKATGIEELIADYDEVCDYYLFEITTPGFDWKEFDKARIEKPFFIAGNIGAGDAQKVKNFKHPDFFGVEIGSSFVKADGSRDMVAVLQFKQALKK